MNRTDSSTVVSGPFDDVRAPDIRFLQEASRLGPLDVLLWTDKLTRALTGTEPKFPESERLYFLQAIRFVQRVHLVDRLASTEDLPKVDGVQPAVWVIRQHEAGPGREAFCAERGIKCHAISDDRLYDYPKPEGQVAGNQKDRKKVLVTGCYDWFHTGHIRFFEECAELGDLTVVVGHDANIRLLKGEGHPMFDEQQRRYVVGSIRYVTEALISTGHGWMDAEPEIERVKPDLYVVNEDGDRSEKRDFCAKHNLEYRVLKRLPKPGLARRESTHLRGF